MSNNTPDWKKDIERLVKLADDMGRSRGPNNYAMNQRAVNELVDLQMALLGRIAELENDAARAKHIDGLSDDDLWHIAGVVEYLSKGSLRNVSQQECVDQIRAAFMDPDAGRAYLKAAADKRNDA